MFRGAAKIYGRWWLAKKWDVRARAVPMANCILS
jgi:hypothetical protein